MKASDLKKILEVPFSIGKSFSPITEYIYVNKNVIKSTDLESYLEVSLNEDMPFQGCVLKEPLQKFLNSIDKNTELNFEVNNNVLMVLYGKKNKFSIPMEDLNNFPESPVVKYTENSFVQSLYITQEVVEEFERAIKFASDTDSSFNGLFLNGDKVYSSNREIIYSGKLEIEDSYSTFIPKNLIKYILKFKDFFNTIEIFEQGFKVKGDLMTLFSPNLGEHKIPDFEEVLNNYKTLSITKTQITEELKNCVTRIKQFDEVVNIFIKEKTINIFTNNINEVIEFENYISKEYSFKFNTNYLKMILDMCDYCNILTKGDLTQPQAFGGNTDKYKIISAVIV